MNKVSQASGQNRRELFFATAQKMNITPAAAEKDFWIVWVLQQVFSLPEWSHRLRFKGGTSLSKAYDLIERFSEDIDLILDWRGLSEQLPDAERSKTKQQQVNQSINQAAQKLIRDQLLPAIEVAIAPLCKVELDRDDPHTINIEYPAEFASGYLRPVVRLEIGPLAAMLPMEGRSITSYAAKYFPQVFEQPSVIVATITAERTFWEKATILHVEAHRPDNKALPARYARHYYDLYRMAETICAERALADTDLLQNVVTFKQKFYPAAWAAYDSATLGSIRLMPTDAHLSKLQEDYRAMREMIFGKAPDFDTLLQTLEVLQQRIHSLNTTLD